MKKLFTLFAVFMLAGLWLKAQTPLTQAVDFTATDIYGVEHTLFDYLDDDKMVVIQFTMVGWAACAQTYPVLQDSYEHYGCHNSNVRFMLISLNHSTAAMLNPPYSNYDYFKIPNPPGGSINGTYGIGAYPTVIIIKPNRAIAEQDIWPINNSILRSKILQHGGIPQDCNAQSFDLTLEANPLEGGEVSGAGEYLAGTTVEINAVSNEGWMFENWTDELGTVVSTDATYSFTMPDNDLTLIANFQMMEYELVLLVNPEESGEVTGGGMYHLGDQVEINAIPYNGWGFLNWTNEDGEEVSATAIYEFSMLASDLTLTANYEPISGLDEVSPSGLLHVFPNPSTGMLKLNIDDKLVGSQYVMYNHLGENILSGQFHTENMVIDMTDFPTGVYFITTTGSLKQSLKIIKK